jgi:hypothetical protein
MDLLLHPVAERTVNKLMLLHHIFPPEFSTHNDGTEVMTVIPFYMHQFAWQGTFDVIFNAFWRNHPSLPYINDSLGIPKDNRLGFTLCVVPYILLN